MTESHTFLLADLASFTALTDTRAEKEPADLARDVIAAVRDLLGEYAAEEIKIVGDELMLRSDDAATAVRLALRIIEDVGAQHGLPLIRAGLSTGPAIDATSNLAARVACLAGGGEVLVTESTRAVALELREVEWQPRGPHPFDGVAEPVEIFAAMHSRRVAAGLPVDPVCGTAIEQGRAAGQLVHGGASFSFCSLRCAAAFASNPDSYANSAASSRD